MLVRLAGIEPTTPWFVAKYSIQLSYSRDEKKYISFGGNGKAVRDDLRKFFGGKCGQSLSGKAGQHGLWMGAGEVAARPGA